MESVLIGSELGTQDRAEWPRKSHCEAHCNIGWSPPPYYMWGLCWTSKVWTSTKGKTGKSNNKKVMRSVWPPNRMCIERGSVTLEIISKPNNYWGQWRLKTGWSVGMQCFYSHCASIKQSTAPESMKASTWSCRWNHDSITGIKVWDLVK